MNIYKYFYPVLESEICKKRITKRRIAEFLHLTQRSLSNKFGCKTNFSLEEAINIHEEFFPNVPIEELFRKEKYDDRT